MKNLLIGLRGGDWLTLERLKRWTPMFALMMLATFALDVWTHTRFGVVNAKGEQLGRDFVNYWSGARLMLQGRAGLAYDIDRFVAFERSLTAVNAELKWYGYPPVAMVLAAPFALFPFVPAFLLWTASGWAILARMLTPRMGLFLAACAVAATPAFFENAISGQNGAFTAVLLAGGIMLLDRRPILAGVLFGLLCYKPHLGVLLPVALVASGRWKTIAAAAAAVAVLAGLSLLIVGWAPWADFLKHAPALHRSILETHPGIWPRMPSLYLAGRQLGAPSGWAYAAQGVSALLAAVAIFAVWRSSASTPLKGAALLIATFLVTPYAWDYDMVVLLFAAVWYWSEAEASAWRPWEKTALAVLIMSPWGLPILSVFCHLQLGPVVLWSMLGLLLVRVWPGVFRVEIPPISETLADIA